MSKIHMSFLHKWLYGHWKLIGIIGYDGIGNIYGCEICTGTGGHDDYD